MRINQSSAPLVKSKQRVADHGEVFTPAWLVEDMLNLVKAESERIDARVLEPGCGSGNFLVPVIRRKLATVELRYGKSDFERRHYALLGLMCIYGIELLADNAAECRANLIDVFASYLQLSPADAWYIAAERVLAANVVQGDALTMTTIGTAPGTHGRPIVFPEWGYLGKGKYQRRDFRYDSLTQRASFQGTLWDHLEEHEIFTPIQEYPAMTVEELAA
ncbi:N-6 DNA methylase [Microbacterium paraoxydans]|uniref:N-6 DNA methylase n=1 Tax=Microbacterium paraoxydans TaxID=199592 RepID=UPI0022860BA9|nr:N-6 DNA methylase [Microbacterium paraoxydans]MCZ0710911.1 N-6 DNA methylase [Microbacterium paraoxydans]